MYVKTLWRRQGNVSEWRAHHRVIVSKGIVDGHVLEEPADVVIEEAFDFGVVELRVDEDGTEISFYNVGEALSGSD